MSVAISRERRMENFRRQSGRKNLTPRQRRRLDKKQASLERRSAGRS